MQIVGDSLYWSMRSDVHDFNHNETENPPRRSHQLMVAAHVVSAWSYSACPPRLHSLILHRCRLPAWGGSYIFPCFCGDCRTR